MSTCNNVIFALEGIHTLLLKVDISYGRRRRKQKNKPLPCGSRASELTLPPIYRSRIYIGKVQAREHAWGIHVVVGCFFRSWGGLDFGPRLECVEIDDDLNFHFYYCFYPSLQNKSTFSMRLDPFVRLNFLLVASACVRTIDGGSVRC